MDFSDDRPNPQIPRIFLYDFDDKCAICDDEMSEKDTERFGEFLS